MTDQSVFTDKQQEDVKPENSNLFTDQLNMIKNENGDPKYDSVPKALEALQHSQQYIPEIKSQLEARDQEIAQLKEQLAKATTLEEVISKVNASQEATSESPPASQQALDEQAILKLISSHSDQEKQRMTAEANELAVS